MLKRFLPHWLVGLITTKIALANTIFFGVIVTLLGIIKLLLPIKPIRWLLHKAYKGWCAGNRLALKLNCQQVMVCNEKISPDAWYLLIANHLSWLDIVVLSAIADLPAPKFFLKDELKYVPFIGSGAWALDMPFMKRASKQQLKKNPKLKGLDVQRTKKSCQHFKLQPSCIINFVEGTRFTAEKHAKQQSPFNHLLKPKACGIAFALGVLGDQFDAILDTTLVYHSQTSHVCRDFIFGRLHCINVNVLVKSIAPELLGDYQHNQAFRAQFQQQLNDIWQQKDTLISNSRAHSN